jgi:ribokinase
MPELVCVGNLTVDESVQPDGARTVAAGGDAVFAALAARLTLDDVTIVAPVGDDLPMELDEAIRRAGTDPGTLPRRALPTVRNVVTYDADGGRDWVLLEGEAHFDAMSVYPADLSTRALAADGILVSAMSFDSQVALGGWLRGHTAATIYLDLQEDYLERVDELLAIVALCDVFLPSEVEALALAGTRDLAEAARFFRGLGPQTVVIKRADKGCVVLAPGADELVGVPAVPVAVVDTTGAGDAFCGAFAATHLLTGDPVAAAESGARAAALAVSGFGIAGLVDALTAVR